MTRNPDALAVYAERSIIKRSIDLMVVQQRPTGTWVLGPGVFTAATEDRSTVPSLSLKYEEAQALMDELWQVGLRPTEGSGSAGSLAATERHLKDMRDIALAALRKEGLQIP